MADPSYNSIIYTEQGGAVERITNGGTIIVETGGIIAVQSGGSVSVASGGALTGTPMKKTAKSVWFNLDNGSGTTIDDVIIRPTTAITLTGARIVYVDATSGTVAAGTIKVGTTVNGVELVAATNYENAKAVGTSTALTLASAAVAANTPVIVRHTGVAATQAGQAYVEIDYTVNA
jgi:hypothetical protein